MTDPASDQGRNWKRPQPIQRRIARFLTGPVSVRNAMAVIVYAMAASVVVGGTVAWFLDRSDFPNIGTGLWWSLQTVTTVGYGDIVPNTLVGRIVGAVIMLEAIAFVSILTALITSIFVERARSQRQSRTGSTSDVDDTMESLRDRLDEIAARLTAIEASLRSEGDATRVER
ncbi:MAG: potassium channel family protein [Labedaea sp.]